MKCEIPLTPEQRIFAAQNHDLIYKFLNEKHLSVDDFYDIVVFGYLRSVYRFFTEPELQQYAFVTIAWKGMQLSLKDYHKAVCRKKRSADIFSFNSTPEDEHPILEENILSHNDLMTQLEIELLLHDLAKRVSKQQMEIVRLKSSGYNLQDIATRQNTSTKRIRKLLDEVRCVLTELCHE